MAYDGLNIISFDTFIASEAVFFLHDYQTIAFANMLFAILENK